MKNHYIPTGRIAVFFSILFLLSGFRADAQDVHLEWVSHIPGTGGSIVTSSMTLDHEDNIIATGVFLDSIEVATLSGNVKLVSKGISNMFVAKLDQSGQIHWIKSIEGKGVMGSKGTRTHLEDLYHEPFFSIVSDRSGNVYITGYYTDSVDFDPGPARVMRGTNNARFNHSFILSLDNDGNFRWVKTLTGADNVSNEIAINKKTGALYVTGKFNDKVDFDDGSGQHVVSPLRVGRGSQDIFIAKYDTSGTFGWAKAFGNPDRPVVGEGIGIHVGSNGDVYATGTYRDSITFDPSLPNANIVSTSKNGNIFVVRTDADGNYKWAHDLGGISGSGNCRGSAITTDSKGSVYTTGYFQGAASFDPQNGTLVPSIFGNGITFFLSKLDSAGKYEWAKIFERLPGRNSADNGFSVAVDDEDNVYAAGYYADSIYLDPDQTAQNREVFAANRGSNSLMVKLTPEGNYVWGKHFDTPQQGHNRALHILVDKKRVFVAGYFSVTTNFDPTGRGKDLTSVSSYDGFIAKLACPTENIDLVVEVCGDEYELNGFTYNQSGDYTQTYKTEFGCDSIIHIDLTLNPITKAQITIDEFTLSTTATYQTYQWILNGNSIAGATQSKYVVTENGAYQVAVSTAEGCTDTSDVYDVTNATNIQQQGIAQQIQIYPNPATELINVVSFEKLTLQLRSLEGKTLMAATGQQMLSLSGLPSGIYFLSIFDESGTLLKVEKVVKR